MENFFSNSSKLTEHDTLAPPPKKVNEIDRPKTSKFNTLMAKLAIATGLAAAGAASGDPRLLKARIDKVVTKAENIDLVTILELLGKIHAD
ncbi:MAG: hypothetical protein NT003_04540, partial [Candidatus Magasanikbacteria bacterium]|nr:hypothetical protein [Candidatus Magasanikbacteria bacterium]